MKAVKLPFSQSGNEYLTYIMQLIGGALSNPLHVDPRKPRGTKFLEKYPYALPNLTVALLFLIGIITGFLFLKVRMPTQKRCLLGLILKTRADSTTGNTGVKETSTRHRPSPWQSIDGLFQAHRQGSVPQLKD
jgi:hypothetical protein